MKITLGVIIAIVAGLLIFAAMGLFFFMTNIFTFFHNTSFTTSTTSPVATAPASTPSPATTISVTLAPSSTPVSSATSPVSPLATSQPASTLTPAITFVPPPPPVTTPSPSPVQSEDIFFEIINIAGSGFNRTATGQLTNAGFTDLHNAKLKVEIYSGGKLIKNNGQPFVEKSFGIISAGTSVNGTVEIKLSLTDGLFVQENGVSFVLTFTSDEKTRVFNY
jgi:hypothetical protein